MLRGALHWIPEKNHEGKIGRSKCTFIESNVLVLSSVLRCSVFRNVSNVLLHHIKKGMGCAKFLENFVLM
jgi:hypothetical protein